METRCQDIGTPTAPHSAPHCGSSSSSSNVANVLVVPVPPLPYSSMSFPFHHCHNFVSQSLVLDPAYSPATLPPVYHLHMIRAEKALLLCNFSVPKTGPISLAQPCCNLPTSLSLSLSVCVISVRQIAFMALDKYSIIDRLNGIDSLRQ